MDLKLEDGGFRDVGSHRNSGAVARLRSERDEEVKSRRLKATVGDGCDFNGDAMRCLE